MNVTHTTSAAALSTMADHMNQTSIREDMTSMRSRRAGAVDQHIDSAKRAIHEKKKAADKRLAAAKKQNRGWIKILMICGSCLAAVASAFTAGASLAGIAALKVASAITAAVGSLTAASAQIGEMKQAEKALDLQAEAARIEERADLLAVEDKTFEKEADDLRDQLEQAQEQYKQIYTDARTRQQEQSRALRG